MKFEKEITDIKKTGYFDLQIPCPECGLPAGEFPLRVTSGGDDYYFHDDCYKKIDGKVSSFFNALVTGKL